MKKFELRLVYNNGNKYVFPIDVLVEVLGLTDEDLQNVEKAILKELQKNG